MNEKFEIGAIDVERLVIRKAAAREICLELVPHRRVGDAVGKPASNIPAARRRSPPACGTRDGVLVVAAAVGFLAGAIVVLAAMVAAIVAQPVRAEVMLRGVVDRAGRAGRAFRRHQLQALIDDVDERQAAFRGCRRSRTGSRPGRGGRRSRLAACYGRGLAGQTDGRRSNVRRLSASRAGRRRGRVGRAPAAECSR